MKLSIVSDKKRLPKANSFNTEETIRLRVEFFSLTVK